MKYRPCHFTYTSSFLSREQVKSIKFTEFNNGAVPELNPVKIHIHINRNNLGFEVSGLADIGCATFFLTIYII